VECRNYGRIRMKDLSVKRGGWCREKVWLKMDGSFNTLQFIFEVE